jgi:hypothetical protein
VSRENERELQEDVQLDGRREGAGYMNCWDADKVGSAAPERQPQDPIERFKGKNPRG